MNCTSQEVQDQREEIDETLETMRSQSSQTYKEELYIKIVTIEENCETRY